MTNNKYKEGVVKSIDRETLELTILGPKNDKGYYREKVVSLHCVKPYEEVKEKGFEFLREKLVGQKIQFQSFSLADKKSAADVFLNKELVAFQFIAEGLGRPVEAGQKTSSYIEGLKEAHESAEEKEKGFFEVIPKKDRKKKLKFPKIEKLIDQKVNGVFEGFNFERDFVFHCWETNEFYEHVHFLGIKIPIGKKEHIQKFKNLVTKEATQRKQEFVIKQIESKDLFVIDCALSSEQSVLAKLLMKGFAKLETEANKLLDSITYLSYKALQDEAIRKRLGVWVDYKGEDPTEKIDIPEPEFDGIVNEIISGNLLVVKSNKTKNDHRVSLTNIKAPKFNRQMDKEKTENWGYQAFEHMRKNYIGKVVHVKIDEIKDISKENEDAIRITNASISHNGSPIGVSLLKEGFALFKEPKMNHTASSFVQQYAQAQEEAKKNERGIFSNKESGFPNFFDITKQGKKNKGDFMLKGYDGYEKGIVIHCFSGTKYKIQFNKGKLFFMFQLNSVKALSKTFENEQQEKVYNRALIFAQNNLLQRDIQFKIENIDKYGNGHGTLLINGKNIAIPLLKKGLAYLDRQAKGSEYIQMYEELQNKAKEAEKGMWKRGVLVKKQKNLEEQIPQTKELKVVLMEGQSFDDLFFQEVTNDLTQMTSKIQSMKQNFEKLVEPISKNSLVLAKFNNEFHRGKILGKNANNLYEVFFYDYGNKELVPLENLRSCPEEFLKMRTFGLSAILDHIKIPNIGNYQGEESFDFFDSWVGENTLKLVITKKNRKGTYCMIYKNDQTKETESINYLLVKEGHALVDENGSKAQEDEWLEAQDRGLEKNPALEDAFEN